MKLTDKDIEVLDSYKNGELTEVERQGIHNRLAEDVIFRQEAHQYWTLVSALSAKEEIGIRDYLDTINEKLPPVPPPPPSNFWLKYLIVALAVALAAIGVWYLMRKDEKAKISAPIAAYFEPYPVLGITRGEDITKVKTNAFRAYSAQKFEEAIPLFQQAFDIEKDTMLLFYKSIAHIANGQAAQAQTILSSLDNADSLPTESVKWYLALAYFEIGEKDKSAFLLKKIADTEGGYQQKAKDLLIKLKL